MSFPVNERQKWEIFCHFEVGIRSWTKEILKIFGGFFVTTFRNISFSPPLFSLRSLLNRNIYKFSYLVGRSGIFIVNLESTHDHIQCIILIFLFLSLNMCQRRIQDSVKNITAQKMKFSITEFFSKCDQICRKLTKSVMENLIFCAVYVMKLFCENR